MDTKIEHQMRWARRVSDGPSTPFGGAKRTSLSMMYGMPDPALFPAAEIAEATSRALADPDIAATALQYGNIQGQPAMLDLLVEKLYRDEGLAVSPANLLVTSGSAVAIGLAARALVDEGDVVLVEAPSFPGAMSVFRRAGARLCSVPMGADGIDIKGTTSLLDNMRAQGVYPRLLYTMPTFHNPMGVTSPQSQREALLELAARYDLMILEDDAYRDLYYDAADGPLPPSLFSLDKRGRVVRTGTFSKILAPGMRLGWALSHPDAIKKMMLLKEEGGTNPFAQHVAIEYARDGRLVSHIETLVDAYRAKRDAMLSALERHFPSNATWTLPAGGFFVWATLPASVDATRLVASAREQGVDYMPGEHCFAEPPTNPGTSMRLSFSTLSTHDIEQAIACLGSVIGSLM